MELKDLLELGKGYRTYAAAVGLLLLAYYQYSGGDTAAALQSVLAALATFGLRSALARPQLPTPPGPPQPPAPSVDNSNATD